MKRARCGLFVAMTLCLLHMTPARSGLAQTPGAHPEGASEAATGAPAKADGDGFVDFEDPADGGDTGHGYVEPEVVDTASSCEDCMQFQRPNPFFGTRKMGVKVLIFAGLAGVFFVLAVLLFHGRVLVTPSVTGLFGWTFLFVLLGILLAAFLSFGEESWNACWCREAMDGKLALAQHFKQLNWVTWAIIGTAVLLVGVAIKAFVKPRARG